MTRPDYIPADFTPVPSGGSWPPGDREYPVLSWCKHFPNGHQSVLFVEIFVPGEDAWSSHKDIRIFYQSSVIGHNQGEDHMCDPDPVLVEDNMHAPLVVLDVLEGLRKEILDTLATQTTLARQIKPFTYEETNEILQKQE